ncbi:MAG: hypothetical protein NZ585_14680 [Chloracidobacterium sp.]|nr:hypothetical protein [Chloracidobacterium sp.]MDW8216657.1 ATP-dependent DNA helicase [Acidobacteriota bacterium]
MSGAQPTLRGDGTTELTVTDILGPGGRLSRLNRNFECRAGQLTMALAVAETLRQGGTLLVEAGTGAGKTLAYLCAAVLHHEPVVISTATKQLQEQILLRDLPLLERAMERNIKAVVLKGRGNYLCLHRLDAVSRQPHKVNKAHRAHLQALHTWATETRTGDRAELPDAPAYDPLWRLVDARSDACLGRTCPQYEDCFVTRLRRRAWHADLVIVNHHLYFADLALRHNAYGPFLPDHRCVVFDEAHEVEAAARSQFTVRASVQTFYELLREIANTVTFQDELGRKVHDNLTNVKRLATAFQHLIQNETRHQAATQDGRLSLTPDDLRRLRHGTLSTIAPVSKGSKRSATPTDLPVFGLFRSAVESLARTLRQLAAADANRLVERLAERVAGFAADLLLVVEDSEDYIHWADRSENPKSDGGRRLVYSADRRGRFPSHAAMKSDFPAIDRSPSPHVGFLREDVERICRASWKRPERRRLTELLERITPPTYRQALYSPTSVARLHGVLLKYEGLRSITGRAPVRRIRDAVYIPDDFLTACLWCKRAGVAFHTRRYREVCGVYSVPWKHVYEQATFQGDATA